ncbi:MFS transporter [Ectobacillus ponti]|uniref:MFS transporter n=1 Tax=Ectobacillus ponti TaxID=2961894 RepID=A0AA42BRU8_9BACI|nr:MFS transporter [Ectobacillus ponti]MCP8970721.1 MFS transporter [Ectobacillus ponti]
MVSIVAISGISQGMLLPAIAMIFEQQGISSSFNGMHATGMYIGILLISPFLEKPMQRFGMKPLIVIGGLMVVISLFLFTQLSSFWIWFALRLAIGVGDHMLHVGTQTWITTTAQPERVGKNVALYGASFGIGFALGPYLASTVKYGLSTPFLVSSILCLIGWLLVLPARNAFPEQEGAVKETSSASRYKSVLSYGWIALLAPFVYGLLEAMLNSNLPVYALRTGLSVEQISFLLPAFAIGSLITQVPLGVLSDRFGRGRLLTWIFSCSAVVFLLAAFLDHYYWVLFGLILLAGMIVGSCFSLGLGYMTDLLPRYLLPAGNILCGIAFSCGSITGPIFGGLFIENVRQISFFICITILLGLVAAVYAVKLKRQEEAVPAKAESF